MFHPLSRLVYLSSQLLISCIPVLLEAQEQDAENMFERLQANLVTGEVVLHYNLSDTAVSVTAIDHCSVVVATSTLNDFFWESLYAFRKKIKSADPDNFIVLGELMHFYLIGPVQEMLTGKDRLIIIPDDALNELPFEAFIMQQPAGWSKHPEVPHFLIFDFEVVYRRPEFIFPGYHYVKKAKSEVTPPDDQFAFIGFSPGSSNYHPGDQLPGSAEEIASIGALYRKNGLSFWLGEGHYSKKDNFKRMATKGRIIHLATHYLAESGADRENGFLFCCNSNDNTRDPACEEILTIDEIGALQFHADLVVLNACGSGMVKSKSGKVRNMVPGIFLEAGAKNIVSTLWNVTDNLAGAFMIDFYRHLLAGKSYGAALREVKLQMLNCRETSLPMVWAPYVLTSR